MLSDAQTERYSRQILLPEIGARGQVRLLSTTLVVVTPAPADSFLMQYLIAAGIGHIAVCAPAASGAADGWINDASRLNNECCIDVSSPVSTEEWISARRPAVVIVDAADDTDAAAANSACVRAGKPLIWGHTTGASAVLAVFDPTVTPGCYACAVVPTAVAPQESVALQSVASSILASLQAAEAIKLALGQTSPLTGRALRIDAAAAAVTPLSFELERACPVCPTGANR